MNMDSIHYGYLPTATSQHQGNVWGWLWCSLTCRDYDEGFNYDWYKGVCTCQGQWCSNFWKSRWF